MNKVKKEVTHIVRQCSRFFIPLYKAESPAEKLARELEVVLNRIFVNVICTKFLKTHWTKILQSDGLPEIRTGDHPK